MVEIYIELSTGEVEHGYATDCITATQRVYELYQDVTSIEVRRAVTQQWPDTLGNAAKRRLSNDVGTT